MELMKEEKQGFKKTDVGLIPEDWELKQIDDIAEVKGGKRLPSGFSLTDKVTPFPYLRVADMKLGGVDLSEIPYVPEAAYPKIKNYRIFKDDLFISVAGTLGIIGEVPEELDGANLTENADRITRIECDKTYLMYLLMSPLVQNEIESVRTLGAQPKLALGRIKTFQIPLPPTLEEQKAIATALSDVDELIRSLDRLIEKKEAIKKGTMQQLLTGNKRLPGFDGDWEVMTLGELFEKIVGGGTPRRSKNEYWNGDIPWATVKDFRTFRKNGTQESITKEGLLNSSSNLIPKGTVITSTRMGLGQAVIYDVDVAINQDLKAIFTNKKLLPNYLYYWFSANKEEIENLGSGSTVKGISLGDLKSFETLITDSLEEQKAIAQILSDMDGELQTLRQKRNKMRRVKEGMMQELLTGKVRLV